MVDDKKYRILLIEKGASMIAASLAEKLGAAGNDVIKCPADVNAINAEKDVSAVILYGSPDLVDDMKVMTFLSDTINEHGLPYYIIGDNKELDAFKGRRADSYSEDETDQFAEVLETLRPEEVAAWGRSLTLRGINLPDSLKDEYYALAK